MDSSLSSFVERVKLAMDRAGISQSDLARACDLTPQYLHRWFKAEKSKNLPPSDVCYKIAKALNVDLVWLIAGIGDSTKTSNILVISDGEPIPDGYVSIPQYKINFNCGEHCGDSIEPMYEETSQFAPAIYKKEWISAQGSNPANCKRFLAHGDSMCPVICDGDCILVDTSYEARTNIRKRGIYAIWYDGSLLCKYLTPKISGGLILSSEDQSKYPSEEINEETAQKFFIIGKVLERSGKISNYIS